MKAGDNVQCRYYNDVEQKFYGPFFYGSIMEIDLNHIEGHSVRPFRICRIDGLPDVWMTAREIKVVKNIIPVNTSYGG